MKRFNIKEWQNKYLLKEQEDPRRPKDIEFDNAQAMDRLTPDDKEKVGDIHQMMAGEKLKQLEKEIKKITGEHGSISEREPGIYRLKFSYVRREFDDIKWNKITDYLQHLDYEIIDANNSYEANYDREEPPEWVPTIKFK